MEVEGKSQVARASKGKMEKNEGSAQAPKEKQKKEEIIAGADGHVGRDGDSGCDVKWCLKNCCCIFCCFPCCVGCCGFGLTGNAPDPSLFDNARFLLVEEDGITERARPLAMANNEHSYGGGRRLTIEQTGGNIEEVGHVGNASRGSLPVSIDGRSHPTLPLQLDQGINKSQLDNIDAGVTLNNDPPKSYNQPSKPPKKKKGSWFPCFC